MDAVFIYMERWCTAHDGLNRHRRRFDSFAILFNLINYNYAKVHGYRLEAELRGQEGLRKDALLTRFGIDHPVKFLHKRECVASRY